MSKCRECGKSVSTLAKTCPKCGVPKPTKKIKNKGKSKENFITKGVKDFKRGLALSGLSINFSEKILHETFSVNFKPYNDWYHLIKT